MGILFDSERRLRCIAAREQDLAATAEDPVRRRVHFHRAQAALRNLPQSPAEGLLLTLG
jgi:hypothetical protein